MLQNFKLGPVCNTPEKFENGEFTLKKRQMFSAKDFWSSRGKTNKMFSKIIENLIAPDSTSALALAAQSSQ